MNVPPLLLRDVEVDGRRVDVRCEDGRITAVGAGLPAAGAARVVHGGGGALLPGLHDHHLHLMAMAAARASVPLGPPAVRDPAGFAAALAAAPPGPEGWVRGVDHDDGVGGPVDRDRLDALVPDRPVRVQDRSGARWTLNSRALERIGVGERPAPGEPDGVERDPEGRATGHLWRLDAWLRERVPPTPLDLGAVARDLSARGVTGVTDATPVEDLDGIRPIATAGLPLRVVVTGAPTLAPAPLGGVAWGPAKIVLEDHAPLRYDRLVEAVTAARRHGRAVAVHSVTAASAALAFAVWSDVGPVAGDRLEHGAVLPVDLAAGLVALGVTVVTNPGFVRSRGDRYVAEVDADEQPDLWRCRSLLDLGAALAAGTDAPYGPADPWTAVAAAVDRRTHAGVLLGADEALAPQRALGLFLGRPDRPGEPRRVAVGAEADLCLLATPLATALHDPATVAVAATVLGGVVVSGGGASGGG